MLSFHNAMDTKSSGLSGSHDEAVETAGPKAHWEDSGAEL